MTTLTKICTRCGEDKPVDEFHRSSMAPDGRHSQCAVCKNAANLANWNAKPIEERQASSRWRQLWHRYRIRPEEYDRIFAAQDGRCAICGSQKPMRGDWLSVDHDHETGEVRGLLCGECNAGLGKFQDNPTLLRAAASYLTTAADNMGTAAEEE